MEHMYNANVSSALGKAWALHRNGQNDQALGEFQKLDPKDIDAQYGTGLVQAALGKTDAAKQSFENAITAAEQGLEEKPGNDRFMMLRRMSQQRISELDKAAPAK
jgi:hypothetical protein